MTDVPTVGRPLYELRGVERTYRRGSTPVLALKGVTTEIDAGGMTAIAGPSGSGKSTLLQLLGALDTPTSGVLTFDGMDLSDAGDRSLTDIRAHHIGFVFQQFNLVPTLTAAENVAIAARTGDRHERKARAHELLEQVGLSDRSDHLPSKLSGGEQQRVAIARALVNRPRVVLADEPTGNLDQTTAADVMKLLAGLAREGVTVVVITHNDEVAEHADRRIGLRDGLIVSDTRASSAELPASSADASEGAAAAEDTGDAEIVGNGG
jgi:putative ABC transport system ATP-binding protein